MMDSNNDLDAIDAQVKALEEQLNQAKQRREAEARKRREGDDLQRQIDELEAQLKFAVVFGNNDDQKSVKTNSSFDANIADNDKPPSRPTRFRSSVGTQLHHGHQQRQEQPTIVNTSSVTRQQQQQQYHQSQTQTKPSAATVRSEPEIRTSPMPVTAPVVGASEQAKRNHQWSKPDWALPSAALPDDDIQKDSIVNPLLKAGNKTNAYERKVQPKDLELIRGTFVAPQPKTPDPRLVWIVVNVDGCKLGKIVMHLHGANIDPIVDVFCDLKGLELHRKNGSMVVSDIDPVFTIVAGATGPGCFGIIQEGRDIFDQCLAAPPQAVLTVKQSHIYPVKKAKPII